MTFLRPSEERILDKHLVLECVGGRYHVRHGLCASTTDTLNKLKELFGRRERRMHPQAAIAKPAWISHTTQGEGPTTRARV
jgi:hypothetical protein